AISISNILSFLPVTIAGFGTRELVFTEVWRLSHFSKEVAISVSTSYFMVTYLGSLLIGGVVYLFNLKTLYRPEEIRKMKDE
ncbi:MAG: flippase-like domain-containing protein, partial [Bacteroidales bacterium]|nr:flippase-like domain-containing protein [Bacteroidales bacterium]